MTRIEKGADVLLKLISRSETHPLRWEAQILEKNTWGRMVVKYDFYHHHQSSTSKQKPYISLIGKFFSDNSGQQTYQFMQALQSIFSEMPVPPIINIPHAYVYDLNCQILVQEYVAGKPYRDLVEGRNYRKYFRLAGRALSFFHSQDIPPGKTKHIGHHLRELIHPQTKIFCEALPQYKNCVSELIKTMKKIEQGWHQKIKVSPIHRDFHLRQLFYRKSHVCLIDWDLFAKGDPALDVGNFLVYLKTHLSDEKLPSIESFLEGYFTDASSEISKRVYLYKSFTYLRLACKCLWLKNNGWKERADKMLRLSEKSLLDKSIF